MRTPPVLVTAKFANAADNPHCHRLTKKYLGGVWEVIIDDSDL